VSISPIIAMAVAALTRARELIFDVPSPAPCAEPVNDRSAQEAPRRSAPTGDALRCTDFLMCRCTALSLSNCFKLWNLNNLPIP
jgi:hypothetical protein